MALKQRFSFDWNREKAITLIRLKHSSKYSKLFNEARNNNQMTLNTWVLLANEYSSKLEAWEARKKYSKLFGDYQNYTKSSNPSKWIYWEIFHYSYIKNYENSEYLEVNEDEAKDEILMIMNDHQKMMEENDNNKKEIKKNHDNLIESNDIEEIKKEIKTIKSEGNESLGKIDFINEFNSPGNKIINTSKSDYHVEEALLDSFYKENTTNTQYVNENFKKFKVDNLNSLEQLKLEFYKKSIEKINNQEINWNSMKAAITEMKSQHEREIKLLKDEIHLLTKMIDDIYKDK
ncbi:hypothetical protein A0H76_137 [Hepatospora eriocheir]|uniref:Uncharacterized protein n=1 Tax=Hepatospora eriocheir TaxID=1081669 RepID=A0A1X0QJ70_9MICR|nr:hypothetical protein HERIO_1341 [Hepatospora eriocheir]ORD99806.1 hypothetical protein A0H76_137 [Hepatospora eriocheir]